MVQVRFNLYSHVPSVPYRMVRYGTVCPCRPYGTVPGAVRYLTVPYGTVCPYSSSLPSVQYGTVPFVLTFCTVPSVPYPVRYGTIPYFHTSRGSMDLLSYY